MHRLLIAATLGLIWSSPATAQNWVDVARQVNLDRFGLTQGRNPIFRINGHLATVLNGHNQDPFRLMILGEDGRFHPSDGIPFRKSDIHGCAAADWASPDGGPDGSDDLICITGGNSGRGIPKQFWVSRGGATFVDLAQERGLGVLLHDRGRDLLPIDIDGEGPPDLVTTSIPWVGGNSKSRAFTNHGGHFRELPAGAFPAQGIGKSECVAVLPRGRYDDVLMCSSQEGVAHLHNTGGQFTRLRGKPWLHGSARKIAVANMDGHHGADLVILTSSSLLVWLDDGQGGFDFGGREAVNHGWGLAACQLDGEGNDDVFVAQGVEPSTRRATNPGDLALLNQGGGRQFRRVQVSSAQPGNADSVTCIEHWRGGKEAALYITNGRWLREGRNNFLVPRN